MRRPVWLTVNVLSAIVSVPLRVETSSYLATVKLSDRVPVPDVVDTVIQSTLLFACHVLPDGAFTVTLPFGCSGNEKPAEQRSEDAPEDAVALAGRRLLIVEDVDENAEIAADLLELPFSEISAFIGRGSARIQGDSLILDGQTSVVLR